MLDRAKTNRQRLALLRLLFSDTPANVDANHFDKTIAGFPPKFREDALHEQIALFAEVAKGR